MNIQILATNIPPFLESLQDPQGPPFQWIHPWLATAHRYYGQAAICNPNSPEGKCLEPAGGEHCPFTLGWSTTSGDLPVTMVTRSSNGWGFARSEASGISLMYRSRRRKELGLKHERQCLTAVVMSDYINLLHRTSRDQILVITWYPFEFVPSLIRYLFTCLLSYASFSSMKYDMMCLNKSWNNESKLISFGFSFARKELILCFKDTYFLCPIIIIIID